jgi:hypothetical protein
LVSIIGIGGGPDAFLVTDSKVGIGNLMTSVAYPNLPIELVLSLASIGHRIAQA